MKYFLEEVQSSGKSEFVVREEYRYTLNPAGVTLYVRKSFVEVAGDWVLIVCMVGMLLVLLGGVTYHRILSTRIQETYNPNTIFLVFCFGYTVAASLVLLCGNWFATKKKARDIEKKYPGYFKELEQASPYHYREISRWLPRN